jgi:hypothetical protein
MNHTRVLDDMKNQPFTDDDFNSLGI